MTNKGNACLVIVTPQITDYATSVVLHYYSATDPTAQSFKKYLDVLLYYRNIIASSSEIFAGNLRKRLSGLRTTFGESSESVRKSSENRQKSRR